MLGEIKAKGQEEKEAEKKIYATYAEWVDDRSKELEFDITTAKNEVEELLAFIAKADNDVAELGAKIAELDTEIATMEADKKEAAALRAADHDEFAKVEQDYSESVDALGRAIQ